MSTCYNFFPFHIFWIISRPLKLPVWWLNGFRNCCLTLWKYGRCWVACLKFASLCSYIYRTKKSNSATPYTSLPHTVQQTEWSSFLQASSCYIVTWHSIGAALFVCTVIWWETCFLSLCPLWLDPGHVGGWEMKRRRSGRIRRLSSGFKACFTHSLWTVVGMKCLWMWWFV